MVSVFYLPQGIIVIKDGELIFVFMLDGDVVTRLEDREAFFKGFRLWHVTIDVTVNFEQFSEADFAHFREVCLTNGGPRCSEIVRNYYIQGQENLDYPFGTVLSMIAEDELFNYNLGGRDPNSFNIRCSSGSVLLNDVIHIVGESGTGKSFFAWLLCATCDWGDVSILETDSLPTTPTTFFVSCRRGTIIVLSGETSGRVRRSTFPKVRLLSRSLVPEKPRSPSPSPSPSPSSKDTPLSPLG